MDVSKLTREAIVAEALALLDAQGVAGVTMRKVAERVGVRAPTLYWYFPDKAALTSAMIDVLFERAITVAGGTTDPKAWVRRFGRAMWRVYGEAPNAALLIMYADVRDENFNRNADRIAEAVGRLAGDAADLMLLQSAAQALMTGWAAFAHGKYGSRIESLFDIEQAALRSLDALIEGWALSGGLTSEPQF